MGVSGVDIPIALIRDDLAANLWLTIPNRIFYANAYRNLSKTGQVIPEIYTENGEYKEVLFSDKLNILVFFDANDERTNIIEKPSTVISIIFAVNLDVIYPGESFRQEENVHRDVIQVLNNSRSPYNITSINLFSGRTAYSEYFVDNVQKFNMQPWHAFKIDAEVDFNYDCDDEFIQTQLRIASFVYPFPIVFTS